MQIRNHYLSYRPLANRQLNSFLLRHIGKSNAYFSILKIWALEGEPGHLNSKSYVGYYDYRWLRVVCVFKVDDIKRCLSTIEQENHKVLLSYVSVVRVSQFPWDAAARIRGWSGGFRCNRHCAEAAQVQGLEIQQIMSPCFADLDTWVAGHSNIKRVEIVATYLSLSGYTPSPTRPVGTIGDGGNETLSVVLRNRRIFDDEVQIELYDLE